jgi:ribonuclease T1
MLHRLLRLALLCLTLAGLTPAGAAGDIATADLPVEARTTLGLILTGGPFPYERDGIPFGNFEKRLPGKPRGYYREYTVKTPGERSRGARRIVAGGQPPEVFYYSDDHYRSFRRIQP